MRILFLTRNGEGCVGAPSAYHGFERAVAKNADCLWAGKGWPLHIEGEEMNETVDRLYGGDPPDWVVDNKNDSFKTPKRRDYRVCVFISDLHGKYNWGIRNATGFIELINQAGYDAVFLKYLYVHGVPEPKNIYLKTLEAKPLFLPWSIDPEYYRPLKKTIDICFLGAIGGYYPMRQAIYEELPGLCGTHGLDYVIRTSPPGRTFQRKFTKLIRDHYVGERYAKVLGQSRILPFGSGVYVGPVQKHFEGRACGCLVMSNEPSEAKELGFMDGVNYVKIGLEDWREKMTYYARHREEAEEIALNGRRLILKRHTHEIRAKEFLEMLKNG